MSAAVPEGIPMDSSAGWEMGAEVHVKDKKLVDPERVWAKGKVVGVEGKGTACLAMPTSGIAPFSLRAGCRPVKGQRQAG